MIDMQGTKMPSRLSETVKKGLGCTSRNGLLSLVIAFCLLILISGCAGDIRLRMGQRPNTAALEKNLRLWESTPVDARAVLGEPNGKGRALLPIDPRPKTIWSYYYEEGDMKDSRRIFLFVFFDQDRFDGYIWFSSLPE